ncbi:MAG: endonuclease III [Clostridia bacterium]|nr:endonuclease III [Clostridia bacterium]NLF21042.1 endonuclease III [Clostridiaceae bacterium]
MDKRPTGKKLASIVIERLTGIYGEPICTLDDRDDPWRLLVAAILAAQCTDERVNLITPALWQRFPEIEDFARALPVEIEPYIRSCGLFRNKAKNIHLAARFLIEEHEGVIPQTMEALLAVPGVGRKIANLLLGDSFGQQAIVVDTHCGRLARRIGLTEAEDPAKVEQDLMRVVPGNSWTDWGHLMVTHGRAVCKARSPECPACVLSDVCKQGRAVLRKAGQ